MVILIKKILTFILLFFTFNTLHIDSNYIKRLTYNDDNLYDVRYHTIYFVNTNTNELRKKLEFIDLNVLSYIIDEKKYYARNIDELEYEYFKDKSISEQINYYNGININGVTALCSVDDLIKIENLVDTY